MPLLWICCILQILILSTEGHPLLLQPISKKSSSWNKSKSQLVYPQLHKYIANKTESSGLSWVTVIVLRTPKETYYIELKPNEGLTQFRESEELFENSTENCHYHGSILSHPEGIAAISICDSGGKMTGTIIFPNEGFVLHPLDLLDTKEIPFHMRNVSGIKGDIPHVLSKIEDNLVKDCGIEDDGFSQQEGNHVQILQRSRRSEPIIHQKVIETSVFVDYGLYRKFTIEKKKTVQEIKDIVLAIINQVQVIYSYSSLTTKLKISLVKLEILSEMGNSPDPAGGNIDDYLDNFCAWQSHRNPPEKEDGHWDHSIMLTGYDLFKVTNGEKNRKTIGLAWMNGMCNPKKSCTLNAESSFKAAFVIAHEMGHSLGMLHDGEGNECDPAAFLMASRTIPGQVTWSKCSNEYLQRFLTKGRGSCLQDDDTNLVDGRKHVFSEELPGHRFDLDTQCKLSLGNEYRPHIMPKKPFNNVCKELWCVSGHWASVAHPALEGSSCGDGGQCIQGKCEKKNVERHKSFSHTTVDLERVLTDFMDKLKMALRFLLP